MIISEIQSEIGHCSCDSAKFKAPADLSHHAILCMTLSLNTQSLDLLEKVYLYKAVTRDTLPRPSVSIYCCACKALVNQTDLDID